MATNHYFNNYNSRDEQRLVEDLIVESIKIQGFDAFYLPNDNDVARDLLFGEDPVKKFKSAFPLEMYLSNAMGYMGDNEFFSKFGLEIRSNVNVIISKRSFLQRVPANSFNRPREGDLVYVPFLNGTGELFEIKFADQNKEMHMLGRKQPYFYELELEKFKYSQELITTGIPDIDFAATESAYTLHLNLGAGAGTYSAQEVVYQSADGTYANATTSAIVQSYMSTSKILTVSNIAGEFVDALTIYGHSSGAQYVLFTFDPLENPAVHETYDNNYIFQQANTITNIAEINPLGKI